MVREREVLELGRDELVKERHCYGNVWALGVVVACSVASRLFFGPIFKIDYSLSWNCRDFVL